MAKALGVSQTSCVIDKYDTWYPTLIIKRKHVSYNLYLLGGGNSNTFSFHPRIPGEMIQFDEHIFQMGWNHQLVYVSYQL